MAWGLFDHEQISTQQLVAMAGVFVMVGLVQSGSRSDEELVELLPEATVPEATYFAFEPAETATLRAEEALVRPAARGPVVTTEPAYRSQCA
jgi:hypothetical protein